MMAGKEILLMDILLQIKNGKFSIKNNKDNKGS